MGGLAVINPKDQIEPLDRCDELMLSQYLDQELNPAQTKRMKSHLQGCATCQEVLSQFSQLAYQLTPAPPALPRPTRASIAVSGLFCCLLVGATVLTVTLPQTLGPAASPSRSESPSHTPQSASNNLEPDNTQTLEFQNLRYQVTTEGAQLLELEVVEGPCRLQLQQPHQRI